MNTNMDKHSFALTDEYLETHENGVGLMDFEGNAYEITANLEKKNQLLRCMSLAEVRDEVRVLLMRSDESALGDEHYEQFWKEVAATKDRKTRRSLHVYATPYIQVAREENALSQLILKMLNFRKMMVSAVRGSVVAEYFGMALAADYRIASESTVISFPHLKMGLPPQGAIAYLLPRYVGYAEAKRILLRGMPIDAETALEKNLIDEIVCDGEFEERSMQRASEFAKLDPENVSMLKGLLAFDGKEVERFLSLESKMLGRRWRKLTADMFE